VLGRRTRHPHIQPEHRGGPHPGEEAESQEGTEGGEEKKEQDKEKDRRKISKSQQEFYGWGCSLGRGHYAWDPAEAAQALQERFYTAQASISPTDGRVGSTGQVFVPETWISQYPDVVDTVDVDASTIKVT
jgi:hypothetical protein